jgi:hypothetical protein
MSLVTKISTLVVRIATEFNSVASSLSNKVDKVSNQGLIEIAEKNRLKGLTKPFNSYRSLTDLFNDQPNQKESHSYYVFDLNDIYVYLGTSNRDLEDYKIFSKQISQLEKNIVQGSSYFNDFDGLIQNQLSDQSFITENESGSSTDLGVDDRYEVDDVLKMSTGDKINSSSMFFSNNKNTAFYKTVEYRIRLRIETLANAEQSFLFFFGRSDNSRITAASKSFGFIYDLKGSTSKNNKNGSVTATGSVNWLAYAQEGGRTTVIDSKVPVENKEYVELRILYSVDSISFFINENKIGVISNNIFSGLMQDLMSITKNIEGKDSFTAYVDYYSRSQTKKKIRPYFV